MELFDADELDLSVVALVSGGHFFSHFYLLAFPPLFPMLRGEFALSNVELGIIMSAVQVGTFLQVFAGDVVDRVGGKRVFVLGIVVTATGIGLAGVAGSYLVVVLMALVSSVGQSAFHPADYALLDAASADGSEGKSFGLHNFAGSLGFAAAPAIVGGIALAIDWRVALVVAGVVGLGYAVVAHFVLDEIYLDRMDDLSDRDAAPTERATLLDPTLLGLFVFFVVISTGAIGIQTFTPVLVVDGFALSDATSNAALTAYFVLLAIGILVGGAIADRFRPHVVIAAALLGGALLTWTVASGFLPPIPVTVIAAFAVLGVVLGLLFPARDRLVNAASKRGATGRSFGFVFTGISVAGVAAPAALGAVIDATDVWVAFWLIGGTFVVAAGIAVVIATGRLPHGDDSVGTA